MQTYLIGIFEIEEDPDHEEIMCSVFPRVTSSAYVIFSSSSSFMRKCVLSIFYVVFSLWCDVLFVIPEIKSGLHFTHTSVNQCFIYTNAETSRSRECVWLRSTSQLTKIRSQLSYT